MNDAVVLAASAVVVALLGIIARVFGFRVKGRFTDSAAIAAAVARADPQATVVEAVADGPWAIARLGDGRLAFVRALGDGATVRIPPAGVAQPRVKTARAGVRVIVPGLDVGFPGGVLKLPAAPAWLTETPAA